jgi:hypothetical protein
MIAAAPIIEQLKQAGFKKVDGVLEWAGLKAAPAHSPALFIIPDSERAPDSERTGVHDQRVTTQFRIVLVLKPNARADGAASKELEETERRIIDALTGWTHPAASSPYNYAGGRILSADGQGVAWAIDFRAAWRLRKGSR